MNGYKTIIGTIGFALCEGAKVLWPQFEQIIVAIQRGVFAPLGAYGIAHKIEKSGEVTNG